MTSISMRVGVALALVCGFAAPLRAGDAFDKGVARRITPEEVQKRIAAGQKPIVLDTRGSVGDVVAKGAVRLPGDKIETWAKDTPKNALIVAYCT
jgi:hypothetical protein